MRNKSRPTTKRLFNSKHRMLEVESLENRQMLSATGWSTAIGGSATDDAYDVATDGNGNSYVGGYVDGQNGFAQSRAFVAKYDSTGSEIWNRTVTNNAGGDSGVWRMASDSAGNSYAAGWFSGGIEFNSSSSFTADETDGSTYDGFLAKYDTDGNLQWVHQFSDWFWATSDLAIREDPLTGTHIYITGENEQSLTFDQTEVLQNGLGHPAAYLMAIEDIGNRGVIEWVYQVQDAGRIQPGGLTVDASGNIYLAGEFNDQTASIGEHELTSGGDYDPFVAKFSALGKVDWAFQLTGMKPVESGDDVAVDSNGNVFLVGTRLGGSLGGNDLEPVGGRNVYLAKIAQSPTGPELTWVKNIGGAHDGVPTSRSYTGALTLHESGNSTVLYLSGVFSGTTDFDPDPNLEVFVAASTEHDQGFLLRLSGDGEFENVWQFGENANGHALDPDGSVMATGRFSSGSSEMVTEKLREAGATDAFLMRLDPYAPVVHLATDSVVTEGVDAVFTASANDSEDGDLSSLVDWTLDGVPYTVDSASVTLRGLTVGTHTLLGAVVDSGGVTGSYTLAFDVVPAAPMDLVAAAMDSSSVALTWTDPSEGETGFIIERALRPKGRAVPVWEQVGEVGADVTAFTDANLSSGNYIYRVRAIAEIAIDEVLSSVWSDEDEVSLSDGGGGGGGGKGGGKPQK